MPILHIHAYLLCISMPILRVLLALFSPLPAPAVCLPFCPLWCAILSACCYASMHLITGFNYLVVQSQDSTCIQCSHGVLAAFAVLPGLKSLRSLRSRCLDLIAALRSLRSLRSGSKAGSLRSLSKARCPLSTTVVLSISPACLFNRFLPKR